MWDLLFPVGSQHGARMPFFIDWLECANPRDTNPAAGDFRALSISTPDADHLGTLLRAIDLDVPVTPGCARSRGKRGDEPWRGDDREHRRNCAIADALKRCQDT